MYGDFFIGLMATAGVLAMLMSTLSPREMAKPNMVGIRYRLGVRSYGMKQHPEIVHARKIVIKDRISRMRYIRAMGKPPRGWVGKAVGKPVKIDMPRVRVQAKSRWVTCDTCPTRTTCKMVRKCFGPLRRSA